MSDTDPGSSENTRRLHAKKKKKEKVHLDIVHSNFRKSMIKNTP